MAGHLFRSITWTLIHSLWQGVLFALLAGLLILFTRKSVPAQRYNALAVLFFSFLALVTCTFIFLWSTYTTGNASDIDFDAMVARPAAGGLQQLSLGINLYADWVLLCWSIVLAWKVFRLFIDMRNVNRLRNSGKVEVSEWWKERVQLLAMNMGIQKTVQLLESARVHVPAVIGHFKPLVLMPVGLLNHLSTEEVEAVLLHELAHVRRHDYAVNILQRISELIFFFNPCLLWISSLLRSERENCCDDIAIGHTGNEARFVEALISFKEQSLLRSSCQLSLLGHKSSLLQRVSRIASGSNRSLSVQEYIFISVSVISCIAILAAGRTSNADIHSRHNTYGSVSLAQLPSVFATPIESQYSTSFASSNIDPEEGVERSHEQIATLVSEHTKTSQIRITSLTAVKGTVIEKPAESSLKKINEYTGWLMDQKQAARDRAQAEQDRLQADKDRRQADLDRKQADLDRIQADKDRQQADKDRQQADIERGKYEQQRMQAEAARRLAEQDRQQAERDRMQAEQEQLKSII